MANAKLGVLIMMLVQRHLVSGLTTTDPMPPTISPQSICDIANPCLNGATCREPDDWECSSDPGMGATVCDCRPGFKGARCEILVARNCGSGVCQTGEACVLDANDVFQCVKEDDTRDITAPSCQTGPHPLNYTIDLGARDDPIVCLDMYYTNTSSLCHDNDSSIEYDVVRQDVADLFCLRIDYTRWQTCLGVNSTFSRSNFPNRPVMDVTLEAKENDRFSRKASITFAVTFNTAPTSTISSRTYPINMAAPGNPNILDIATDFGVTDDGAVEFTLDNADPRLSLNPDTGELSVMLRDRDDIKADITVSDDGIPPLSTSLQLTIKVFSLACTTDSTVYVSASDVGSATRVGRLRCEATRGYTPVYNFNTLPGVLVSVPETARATGLMSVMRGGVGDHDVQVTVSLAGKVSVDLPFTLRIRHIQSCVFVMPGEVWLPDYSNLNSPATVALRDNVIRQINGTISAVQNVTVEILLFRPGSVVAYFMLLAESGASLDEASNLLATAVSNGALGTLAVQDYETFKQVGLALSTRLDYFSPIPTNTANSTINNTQVELTCEGIFLLPVGVVMIEWRMTSRNALVVPLPTSRLQTETTNPSQGVYQSVLSINNILYKDRGPFTCVLMDDSEKSARRGLGILVIAPPLATLTPLSQASIALRETLVLTCNVTEPRVPGTNITWYKDNVQLPGRSQTTLTSVITVTGQQLGSEQYHCQGGNLAGRGVNSNILTVTTTPGLKCEADGPWPPSTPGTKAEAPCPPGESGVQSRVCGDDGTWLEVDTSQCVSDDIGEVINDIQYITEGVQVSSLSTVAQTLGNRTAPNTLEGAEVALIADSLDVLLDIAHQSNISNNTADTKRFTQGFVDTADNLLNPETSKAWETSGGRPTSVLTQVDRLTELTSDSLLEGGVTWVQSNNIDLLVGKSDPNQIKGIVYPKLAILQQDSSLNSFLNLSVLTVANISAFEPLSYSTVYYKNITAQLPSGPASNTSENATLDVNSDTLALNLFISQSPNLTPPLLLNFSHTNKSLVYDRRVCAYLNIETDEWESDGCNVTETGLHFTVCSCDHLTNFALLMNPYSQGPPPPGLTLITIIGCSISVFCLVLTLIIYTTVWRYVKSDQAVLLVIICVTLALAMIIFVVGVDKTAIKALCTSVAVSLHFFYLVTFFMMLAAGLEIVWTVVQTFSTRSKLKPLVIGGWILPLVIVGLSMAGTQMKGYGTEQYCWLSTEGGLIWAFVGPVLLIVTINFVLMGKLVHVLLSTRAMLDKAAAVKIKKALRGVCILVPILGVSWVFGVLAVNEDLVVFQYIFAVLNSLQGLFIFITQVCMSQKIRNGLKSYRRRYLSRQTLSDQRRNAEHQPTFPLTGKNESSAYQNLLPSSSDTRQPVSNRGFSLEQPSGQYHDIVEESSAYDQEVLDRYNRPQVGDRVSHPYGGISTHSPEHVNHRKVIAQVSSPYSNVQGSRSPNRGSSQNAEDPFLNLAGRGGWAEIERIPPQGEEDPEPDYEPSSHQVPGEDFVPYSNRADVSDVVLRQSPFELPGRGGHTMHWPKLARRQSKA